MNHLRLFLHVFAGSIWVGGQIVMIALLPTVRKLGGDAAKLAGQAFNRVAWPAFGLLVATGIWNLFAIPLESLNHPWIEIKLVFVLFSGIGALMHQLAKGSAIMLAIGGTMSLGFAVGAMYLGFLVAG